MIAVQQQIIFSILEWLWDFFVEPVFEKLGYTAMAREAPDWPRVWWCPTGVISFLPIHATGYHKAPSQGRTVLDRVVSSYTSSIRALKYSRDHSSSSKSNRALIIAMTTTPGHGNLPLAEDEGHRINYILGAGETQPKLAENVGVEVICNELPTRSIVHFICHAISEADPSTSRLVLNDGSLTVARISQLKIDPGAVAYLSACSTAVSQAERLEDECIALSTAFQVAGFAGVVGCLWKADDYASFQMATSFYEYLQCENLRAAQALHRGVRDLRTSYPEEPSIWALYMYTGA
jgi:CHAT domain-containing protein